MEKMSKIENYARGDAVQIMVSTNGKLINGKNYGVGSRTRQLGGYVSDASLQHLSQNLFTLETQGGHPSNPQYGSTETTQSENATDQHRWAEITPISTPCSTTAMR